MSDIQFVPSYEDVVDITSPYARPLKDFRFTVRRFANPEGAVHQSARILEQAWQVYEGGQVDRIVWREVEIVTGE